MIARWTVTIEEASAHLHVRSFTVDLLED
uniref:Uncharacterized protein n=1 Tax=Arundo donax TaxID=35708 RepID=A0A0A9EP56_ARUDO